MGEKEENRICAQICFESKEKINYKKVSKCEVSMTKTAYGKIRKEDLPLVREIIDIFKKHNLKAGLHGTSLWNPRYMDIDLLVVSNKNLVDDFLEATKEIKNKDAEKNQKSIKRENGKELASQKKTSAPQ